MMLAVQNGTLGTRKETELMKKHFFTATLLLVLLLGVLSVTSCGLKELSIETNPQLIFVQGNELDLSAGMLSADGKSVPFNADGVEVTGYNKDLVGEQTLTVTYRKKSLHMNVIVVPRIQAAESYVYFVGESMDAVGLRMKVWKDDGTSFSVSADDENVTVTGFASEAPSDALDLQVSCKQDGVTYEGSITVSVVTPDITFKKPRKTEYGSHETELDTTGVTLTLKNADGKTVRNIEYGNLTFEGFDPTAATAEKPSVTQTIRVFFGGREMASFDITVTYSHVSMIRDAAKDFMALDWSHYERVELGMYLPQGATDEMGRSAMTTLELYYNLSDKDAALISRNEMDAIARLAVIYGYNQWGAALERAYHNVFEISIGDLTYTCTALQDAKDGLAKLRAASDEDTQLILTYSSLLKNEKLNNLCGETVIYQGAQEDGEDVTLTVGDMLTIVYDAGFFTNKVSAVLEKMVAIPELVTVPADWSADTLSSYKDGIEGAYTKLIDISLSDASGSGTYELINDWRENKDLFEILYRYYFGVYTADDQTASEEASKKIDKLTGLMLPGKLQEMYGSVVLAQLFQTSMASAKQNYDASSGEYPLVMESTYFFTSYEDVQKRSTEIFDLDDAMYNEVYRRVFAGVVLKLQWDSCGYYDLLGTSALDDECLAVLKQYRELWAEFEDDSKYVDSKEFEVGVSEMFHAFVALRPNQQYNVMNAINYMYGDNHVPSMVLYPNDGALFSEFATFIYAYYLDALGVDMNNEADLDGTAYTVFTDLMISLEAYANGDWTLFGNTMSTVRALYADWNGTQKDAFDRNLLFLYEQYDERLDQFEKVVDADGETTYSFKQIALGDYEETFRLLSDELTRAQLAKLFIEDLSQFTGQSVDMYLAYLASYERVRMYADEILNCGDESILRAFYWQPMGSDGNSLPLYNSVYDAEGNYKRYLLMMGVGEDDYCNENTVALRNFLREYADYFWVSVSLMYPTIQNPMGGSFEMNAQNIRKMMADFRALSSYEKYLLYGIDSLSLYYGGISIFLAQQYPNSAVPNLAYTLMLVEIYNYTYESDPEQTVTLEDGTVKTVKELLLETWYVFDSDSEGSYQSLSSSDKAIFDQYFKEMTAYYRDVCARLED